MSASVNNLSTSDRQDGGCSEAGVHPSWQCSYSRFIDPGVVRTGVAWLTSDTDIANMMQPQLSYMQIYKVQATASTESKLM